MKRRDRIPELACSWVKDLRSNSFRSSEDLRDACTHIGPSLYLMLGEFHHLHTYVSVHICISCLSGSDITASMVWVQGQQ